MRLREWGVPLVLLALLVLWGIWRIVGCVFPSRKMGVQTPKGAASAASLQHKENHGHLRSRWWEFEPVFCMGPDKDEFVVTCNRVRQLIKQDEECYGQLDGLLCAEGRGSCNFGRCLADGGYPP